MQRCEQKRGSPRSKRNRLLNNPNTPPARRLSLHHKQTLPETNSPNSPTEKGSSKETCHENDHGVLLQPRVESKSPTRRAPNNRLRLAFFSKRSSRWVHATPQG